MNSFHLQTRRVFSVHFSFFFFFFNDTATTEIYTLSLHDALPISIVEGSVIRDAGRIRVHAQLIRAATEDRKSTRLNSSHEWISYAVFCLKKKKINKIDYKSREEQQRYTAN